MWRPYVITPLTRVAFVYNGPKGMELAPNPHYIDVVKSCQSYFAFSLPSDEWAKRAKNLDAKYIACETAFVHYGNTMFH